jgi:hypothetical protein
MSTVPPIPDRGAFLVPSFLQQGDKVLSASTEYGLIPGIATPDDGNDGRMILRPSGTPTSALSLDVKVQRGGNPTGYATAINGTPGASVIFRATGGSSTSWKGYNDNIYITRIANVLGASAGVDFPGIGTPRTLGNGYLGFVYLRRSSTPNYTLRFAYKSSMEGAWTTVQIIGISDYTLTDGARPEMVVLPNGDLICFARVDGLTFSVVAYKSTDNGLTWSLWSDNTRTNCNSAQINICAEYTQGAICLIVGRTPGGSAADVLFYWSSDGGQSFTLNDTQMLGTPRTCVSVTGQVLLVADDTLGSGALVYGVGIGGGASALGGSVGGVVTANPSPWIATRDDGVVWGGTTMVTAWPSSYIGAQISLNHGLDWDSYDTSLDTIFYNGLITGDSGIAAISAGFWQGSLVLLIQSNGTTAAFDDSIQEIWYGGYDTLTERYKAGNNGAPAGWTGGEGAIYHPVDYPQNLGWTRTDTGAGATLDIDDTGLKITSTAANNTSWSADSTFWPSGDSHSSLRMRFWYKWGSIGTGLGSARARLFFSASDGTDRQWVQLEFGPDQLKIVDSGGVSTLSANVANQFKAYTEVFLAFTSDFSGGATTGTLSLWYNIAGAGWVQLANGIAIARQAGVATKVLLIGGTAASAAEWWIGGLVSATDSNDLEAGFTNPDDLAGRQVGTSSDPILTTGLSLAASGAYAVPGDLYTVITAYSYSRRLIWDNPRPSSIWQSTATTGNVVFDAGSGDKFDLDTVCLFGTNFIYGQIQLHTADSWASPSVTISLDATIDTNIGVAGVGVGYITIARQYPNHKYRSAEGRRYYALVSVASVLSAYEITDTITDDVAGTTTVYIEGVDFSGATPDTTNLAIFGDRMYGTCKRSTYRYMRLYVALAVPTVSGRLQVGYLAFGRRYAYKTTYDSGFKDRTDYNVTLATSTAGQRFASRGGAKRRQLEIAWGPLWNGVQKESPILQALADAVDGNLSPIVHIRNLNQPEPILYRIMNPWVIENIASEGLTAMERPAQITLSEEL